MHIECPSCSKENKIDFAENIICAECKTSFAGYTYKKFKKPLLSATAALIIGAVGAHRVDRMFLVHDRYPVQVEYELVDSCVNGSRSLLNSQSYSFKREVCSCALQETMEDISLEEMKKSESVFLTRFRAGVTTCSRSMSGIG